MEGRRDVIGGLLDRNLVGIVEDILYFLDASSVSSCFQVCPAWANTFTRNNVWRRLAEMRCRRRRSFRSACKLNGWSRYLAPTGGGEGSTHVYKSINYKALSFDQIITYDAESKKLYTGSMFSCLKLHRDYLFVGMLGGIIKMWSVKDPIKNEKPIRVFEGHLERVTALDAEGSTLVSSSIDHSVRVWNLETGALVRLVTGAGAPLLLLKLTQQRLIAFSKSGEFCLWVWNGPRHIEYLYNTSILHHNLSCVDVVLEDPYLVVLLQSPTLGDNEVQMYSSSTGRHLAEKVVNCAPDVLCMDVVHCILCLGYSKAVEVWNLEECVLVNRLDVDSLPSLVNGVFIKNISLSDFMLVVMASTGAMHIWPVLEVLQGLKEPGLCIDNTQPCWKNIALSDTKIAFGLEAKFGDMKIYSFTSGKEYSVSQEPCATNECRKKARFCQNSCCNLSPVLFGSITDLK